MTPTTEPGTLPPASHFDSVRSTWPARHTRQPPSVLVIAPYARSVPIATVGLMPATMMSSGVISEPPPIPVSPMRMPTPSPNTMTSGSMSGDVQPALGLVGPGPAAPAAAARRRARPPADRLVPAVVQLVVGQVALVDAA